ncbi:MAG: hypothetical protein ACE5R4_14460 [Armatimonadota bacterium]
MKRLFPLIALAAILTPLPAQDDDRPLVVFDSRGREAIEGGKFQLLRADLEREKLEVTTTRRLARRSRPIITPELLEDCDVLVTDQRDAYEPGERRALLNFVREGGGLLVLYEAEPGLPLGFGARALLAELRITARPGETGLTDYVDRTHPIMLDVRELEDPDVGTDFFAAGAQVLAEIRGRATAVAREVKQGRALAADRSLFRDPAEGRDNIELADNRQFAANCIRWLARTLKRD